MSEPLTGAAVAEALDDAAVDTIVRAAEDIMRGAQALAWMGEPGHRAAARARLLDGAARVRAALGGGWREGPPEKTGVYAVEVEVEGHSRVCYWCGALRFLTSDGFHPGWPTVAGRPARYMALTLPAPPESEGR